MGGGVLILTSKSTCSLMVYDINLVSCNLATIYYFQKVWLILSDFLHGWLHHLWTKNFISSFPICIFIFFSCLVTLARTFSMILKSRGKVKSLPYSLSQWESFEFLTIKYVSCRVSFFFIYIIFFIKLGKVPSIPSLLIVGFFLFLVLVFLVIKGCWILSTAFSIFVAMIIWFFFFRLLGMLDYISWFSNAEPGLHTWDKFHWVVV